jgi:uncharacterized protein YfiM (DUF2279 family)
MRFIFKLTFWLTVLSAVSVVVLAWFSLEQQPLIVQVSELSHTDIARAKQIIKKNDPRRMPAGSEHEIHISERDLNLAANYLVQKMGRIKGAVQARVMSGETRISGSMQISGLSFRPYLNISLTVTDVAGKPQVSDLRIGQLDVPGPLARVIVRKAIAKFNETEQGELTEEIIKKVEFAEEQLAVSYLWQPSILDRARDTLINQDEQEATVVYYNELAALQAGKGSLTDVLQPLFALAQRRSQSGADPVSENRALLLVLGAWALNQGMDQVVPREVRQRRIKNFRLALNRRVDLAQHFVVSAAIASSGDTILSNAVGLYKEVSDSQGSSGFSFADLAADRAGTRFGEEATRSDASARRIQQLLASGVTESDIMPRSKDLPENVNAAQFKRRYGEIGSRDYNRVANEIERRVAACSIYRGS